MANDAQRSELDRIVNTRIAKTRSQISHSLRQIAAGNPLGAESNRERMVARLALKTGFDTRQAEALSASITDTAAKIAEPPSKTSRPEAVWGTADFIGVHFFERGRRAANAVGRISFRSGRVQGTGFLVGPGLLLTNNHVIQSVAAAESMCIQFDFESDLAGRDRTTTLFAFEPSRCFAFAPINGLDFTLVALGGRLAGVKPLSDFGYVPLSDAGDKHMLGEFANIVQHPEGRLKQIVLRNNNLVAREETTQVLHYVADTQPGSSGSPVFNNEWEAIALHHWAGPHLETRATDGRKLRVDINEGIRISAIVRALRQGAGSFDPATRQAVADALRLWDGAQREGPVARRSPESGDGNAASVARTNGDGSVSWIFPVEISVRSPLMTPDTAIATMGPSVASTAPERREDSAEDYSDRGGYEPGFIPGFTVSLPGFSGVSYRVARNQASSNSDDEFELRYTHFSVVMNADRKLAAFTACNIDGARVKAIDRTNKTVTADPSLKQLGVEFLGPEATDAFRPDPRVTEDEQMSRAFYEEQEVPGFDKPKFPAKNASAAKKKAYYKVMRERTARMLQKGHIIMRGDPAWGSDTEALAAEDDTFHYTNAAPQFGFFNQGSRDDHPGEKGKLRWRTVETYVLRNAVTTRKRVSVFAGPVFRNDDPDYRFGSKIPMRFWKIAVWADGDDLRSIAVIADQTDVFKRLTKGVPEALEAFDDPDELSRVAEFRTTVAAIERLTELDFGDAVRAADIHAGQPERALTDDPNALVPRRRRRRRLARAPRAGELKSVATTKVGSARARSRIRRRSSRGTR